MRIICLMAAAFALVSLAPGQELPQGVELLQTQVFGSQLAVDSQGNIYLLGHVDTGVTSNTAQAAANRKGLKIGFVPPPPCIDGTPDPLPDVVTIRIGPLGCADIVVYKLDPTAQRIIYAAAIGGTKDDFAESIKVDAAGNVYISGRTGSDNFPATSYQGKHTGYFILKLNPSGQPVYNTVLGWADLVYATDVDSAGAVYFSGSVTSGQLPVSPSAYRSSPRSPPATEGFVAKLEAAGKEIQSATYTDAYTEFFLRVRQSGDILISGYSQFAALDSSLSRLRFSTSFEIPLGSLVTSLGTDNFENIYVVDARYVRKYAPDGQRLMWVHDFQSGLFTSSTTTRSGTTYLFGVVPLNFPTFNGTQPCMSNLLHRSLPAEHNLMAVVETNGDLQYATYIAARDTQPFTSLSDDRIYLTADQDLAEGIPRRWNGLLRVDPAKLPVAHASAGCLVHSATLRLSDIAPGTIMTLYGDHMGPAVGASFTLEEGHVPFELAGTSITVDGTPAPVLYAQDNQVNFVAPWSLRTDGVRVPICVTANKQSSCLYADTAQAAPGFFLSKPTQIAAINQDGTINSPDHPAPSGSYLSVYWTGSGLIGGSATDGGIAGLQLQRVILPVSAVFNYEPCSTCGQVSANAEVLFAGAVPTLIYGASVVIVRVPEHPPSASAFFILNLAGQAAVGGVSIAP